MINFFSKKRKSGERAKAHIFAGGRVQGVYYRETCRKKAEQLGVTGWVQNLKDGRVEAVFEGEKENVQRMVNWAKRGPFFASVESFDVVWEDYKGEFKKFDIIRILD